MAQTDQSARKPIFAAIAVLLGLIAAIATTELAVRLLLPRATWEFRDATDDWQLDARIGWIQKRNLEVTIREDSGRPTEFRTNGDGLQPSGAARAKPVGITRVMLLGDSTVVGRGVPERARVHRQLEMMLRARGIPAEVLNAGVQGYSTDQELLQLDRLGPLYRPDIVILAVCTNDFGQNSEESANGVNKPRFMRDGADDLKYMPPAPQEQISRFGGGLAAWVQYSAAYRAIQPAVFEFRAALGNWREKNRIHLANALYYSPAAMKGVDLELFEQLLVRMRRASEILGARFYVYLHPAIDEVWEPYIADSIRRAGVAPGSYDRHAVEKRMAAISLKNEIRFVPQVDIFLKRSGEGPFHLLPRDPHCNETCYRITSETLAEAIVMEKPARNREGDDRPAGR